MESLPASVKQQAPTWLKSIIIGLLALGIFFRFAHLGQKVYWHDEAFTSLAISGHTLAEVKQAVFHHQGVMPITALNQYQHVNPDRGVADTVRYLVTSDPQHPPLYYVLVRLWAQVVGDSPAALRSLSACLSLLLFPCVYWLCLELFNAPIVGWVALGVIAISPLEIFFAQEARQYGLWMVTILLAAAALLQALRRDTRLNWLLYGLTLAIGLYTHLFTILVAAAHGIYVLISQRSFWNKTLRNYLLATTIAFLLFLPWLVVFISNIHTALQLTSWSSLKIISNPLNLVAISLTRSSRIFFDINLASDAAWVSSLASESLFAYNISTIIAYTLFLTYLIYFFIQQKASLKLNLFVILLGIIPGLSLLLSDLFFGGIRSIYFRYQLPFFLSLQIVVSYVLVFQILSEKAWRQTVCQFMLMGLIVAELISDFSMFQADSWWVQINGRSTLEIARLLNQAESPLLLSDDSVSNVGAALTLSRILQPKVSIFPIQNGHFLNLFHEYKNIFFFDFNNTLHPQIQQDKAYSITLIDPIVEFWQIEKNQQ